MSANLYRSLINKDLIVEYVSTAEMRIGEMRKTVVIYRRKYTYYVRVIEEFKSKFEPVK